MRTAFLGTAAIAIGGLFLNSSAHAADDTTLLLGVGSMNDIHAPLITLQGDASTAADTFTMAHGGGMGHMGVGGGHIGGFGHVGVGAGHFAGTRAFYGGYRGWGWGGYRGWGWGGYRGWGLYRPWYGFYRPWGLFRPWGWYPGIGVSVGVGGYGGGYASAYPSYYPSVSYYPQSICGCDVGYPTAGGPPGVAETAPPPRPNDGFRYDGGPARPIPPAAAPPPRAVTPPVTAAPGVDAIAIRPAKKRLEYPAYGETPSKPRVVRDPLLVKDVR